MNPAPTNKLNRFLPLARLTLATQVADQVRHAIVSGELLAHEAVAEGKLAQQLGVSRAPVREALLILEREGLIESLDNGRRRVCKLTTTDYDELLDMRIAIESRTCFLLATRMTDAVVARLEASIEEQAACDVLLELSLLDIDFHTVIAEAAGNRRLLDAWMHVKPQLELWLTQIHVQHQAVTEATFRITVDSHQELLGALRGGNPEVAEKAIRMHVQESVRLICLGRQCSAEGTGDTPVAPPRNSLPENQSGKVGEKLFRST